MMTQTLALFLDAYRELHAKKMFWIVLGLNILFIAGFGILGFNGHTLTILWFEPFGDMRDGAMKPQFLYKYIFNQFVVGFWLAWLSVLLGLISAGGIFPDFLSSGSIDLFLAKPIGRLRLFFTKYLAALLFVTLQVTVFSALSFLVLGLRAGLWQPGLFWSIPLLVLLFSYLYAICALLGVISRSTVAAILLTLLAWFGIWAIDMAQTAISAIRGETEIRHAIAEDRIDALDGQIQAARAAVPSPEAATQNAKLLGLERDRADAQRQRDDAVVSPLLRTFENFAFAIKTVVPKTRQTIDLLDRVLFSDREMQDLANPPQNDSARNSPFSRENGPRAQAARNAQIQEARHRSVWWIIGTSLAFEAVILALAAWYFCTRDF